MNESEVIAKVTRRLMPIMYAVYFASYIDRSNLSFAALTMNEALGFSPKVFGLGAALFAVGYVLLQVPGNLMLNRFGARRLIAAITFVWGIFACSMAFAGQQRNAM